MLLDTIIQINVVMDFVGGYHSKLVNDFINLFGERRTAVELLMDCQNQSSDILQHSQNRPTGDRWLKF